MILGKLPESFSFRDDEPLKYVIDLCTLFITEDVYDNKDEPKKVGDLQLVFNFIERFNNQQIGKLKDLQFLKEFKERLINLGYDPEKFWYLTLFIYDYSNGIRATGKAHVTVREELTEVIERIHNNSIIDEYYVESVNDSILTLKIGTQHSIEIRNPVTLCYIADFCKSGLQSHITDHLMDDYSIKTKGISKLKNSTRISCFGRLLYDFLQNCFDLEIKVERYLEHENKTESKKNGLYELVADLAIFTGIADDNTDRIIMRSQIEQYRSQKLWNDNPNYNRQFKE